MNKAQLVKSTMRFFDDVDVVLVNLKIQAAHSKDGEGFKAVADHLFEVTETYKNDILMPLIEALGNDKEESSSVKSERIP
jgi:hypothetical protein